MNDVHKTLRAEAIVLDHQAIRELIYTAADAATSGYDWDLPDYRRD